MMNEELQELEFELRRLRPRAPSEFFDARVEAALETRGRVRVSIVRGVAAAGFAAGVAWLAALGPGTASRAGVALRPVEAQETLQSAREEGWVTLDDGTKARQLRLRYLETVRWSDGHRTLTWTQPREELRILPVAAY
jgi:hypothetical protein